MKKFISINEVVESASDWRGAWDVCAGAEARCDEGGSTLVVELDCCVRPAGMTSRDGGVLQDWLLRREPVRERVPLEEAVMVAKDVSHRRTNKVRRSILSIANH
jgi:hypothetical protein